MNLCSKFCQVGLLALLATAAVAQAAPTNDLFADRIFLTGTNVTVQGNNSGAGTEPGEDAGSGNILWFYSVWYSWTSPTNGVLHLAGSNSVYNFYMSVRVYRGAAVSSLTLAPALGDGGIAVTPGDTINIQVASIYYPVWSGGGGTGPFTLTLWLETPAPTSLNDQFTNRFEITAPTSHFAGSIYGATNETGEPLPDPTARQTLWWKFVPPVNGTLNLWPSTPQFTSSLTVYDGTDFATMTPVPPLSGSTYSVAAGHEYSIQMASDSVPGGAFTLDTRFYGASNDMFSGSDRVEGTNFTYYGSFSTATFEPGEPPSPATNTVWIAWTAPCTGRVRYNMAAAAQFQYCNVYVGASLALLQPVPTVALVNRVTSFLAIEGTVYYFQFSGGANDFTFSLSVDPLTTCSNDNFVDAQLVKGNVIYFDPKSVLGATMELGEPAHMGAIPEKSLWWKWQAPLYGTFRISSGSSLVSNVVLAAYTGNAVEALTLVGKGTNQVTFPTSGGWTYYIAGAVETNAIGDIANFGAYAFGDTSVHIVGGNLLQEPSWEGTYILEAQFWHWSGGLGGYVNENGDCDGRTWPALGSGTVLWQDFPTIPGRTYGIRFACYIGGNLSGCCGDARVLVSWDSNQVGSVDIPGAETGFWHWGDFTAIASNTTSRISFQNLWRNVEMDAFSVVDLSAPPAIVAQPTSISTVAGGTAAFVVGATGSSPLSYQWFFNGALLSGETARQLVLNPVSTNQAGNYFVRITNGFGAVTSTVASLFVEAPTYPTIVWEPYGDRIAVGGYYGFSVAAVGGLPLDYQWFFKGASLQGATNKTLALTNIQPADAGIYQVRVHNSAGTVWSLPATLVVTETNSGGGTVFFQNKGTNVDAPVFDIDGVTRLSGGSYLAQLYAGPSLEWLRPVGQPTHFQSGFNAGYVVPQTLTLANVAPGSAMVAQVRAWDGSAGNSYEEARALGGRFGKTTILSLTASGSPLPPAYLAGLQSFSLQAGLPGFTVGVLHFVERQPDGTIVWSVTGEPGYRYLVEKAFHNFVFQPYVVVTNITGTVTFTDSPNSGSAVVTYRARILD